MNLRLVTCQIAIVGCLTTTSAVTLRSKPITLGVAADAFQTGGTEKKLVFLDFYNESDDENLQYLSNSIGDAVDAAIQGKYRYRIIPAAAWKRYATENKWEPKDYYDEKKIRDMGKALGADGVIYGKYVSTGGNLEIQGVIFSVIDGEIVDRQKGETPVNPEMFETINLVSENLAKKIKDLFVPSDRGAMLRSLIFPGWGHFYKQRRTWGYLWGGAAVASLAYTAAMLTLFIVYKTKYAQSAPSVYTNAAGQTGLYDQTGAQTDFDHLETTGNQFGQLTLIGVGVSSAIYLAAFIHAYLVAPDLGNVVGDSPTTALPFYFNLGADSGGIQGRIWYHTRL